MRGSRVHSNAFLANPSSLDLVSAMRQEGMSYKQIAAQFGISDSFLARQLRVNSIPSESPMRVPSTTSICLAQSAHIIRLYTAGCSCREIGHDLGFNEQAVRSLVKHMGLLRDTKPYQKLLDHSWFDSFDCEVKAYFLGLVAADGWIHKNTVFIALKESEKQILKAIPERAFPFVPIRTYPPGLMNVEAQCRIAITSRQWIARLNELGITEAKSLTMCDITNQIPAKVRHHFVRGYFDGDGSISHSVYRGKRRVLVSFRGTRAFLQGLHDATGIPVGGTYPKQGDGIKALSICGKGRMLELADYLYRDATIFLSRKKNRFVW